jgi:hypothetical protein
LNCTKKGTIAVVSKGRLVGGNIAFSGDVDTASREENAWLE